MTRLVKLLLAFSLCFMTGCSSQSKPEEKPAENTGEENIGNWMYVEEDGVIDAKQFGMKITIPEELRSDDCQWALSALVTAEVGQASLISFDPNSDAKSQYYMQIVASRKATPLAEHVDEEIGLTEDMIHDLGNNGTYYYLAININDLYQKNPDYVVETLMSDMTEEEKTAYLERLEKTAVLFDNIELTDLVLPNPVTASDIDSSKLMDITVQDFDGKEIRLGDLIAENEVTMINFWGTFCGSCVQEMPSLEALSQKYKDKGFGIIGICMDITDDQGNIQEDLLEDGIAIVEDTGVTYPCVIGTKEIRNAFNFIAFPTTYFVDSEGNMILDPITGANSEDGWETIIQESLNK